MLSGSSRDVRPPWPHAATIALFLAGGSVLLHPMPREGETMAEKMAERATARNDVASLDVLETMPQVRLTLRGDKDAGSTTVLVDGMPAAVAMEIPWGPILDKLGDLIFGGGGGGKGDGCTTIKITNPDGSTTEIKQCPAPKTA